MDLALFDFDGTITEKESISDFLKYVLGEKSFYMSMLRISPMLIGYVFGFLDNRSIKQQILTVTLKGKEYDWLKEKAFSYVEERLAEIIRPKALERIYWHKERGDRVVIVSAGLSIYIRPWAEKVGVDDVIAMELERDNGKLTGRLIGENCYGKEKVFRIKKKLDISQYNQIFAYGDSVGDREMLQLADRPFYKPFR